MRLHPTGKFDNRPLPARFIDVKPLAAAMGAEIGGTSIPDLSDEAFAETFAAPFAERGYAVAHYGEGRWNGVAIAARTAITDVVTNFGKWVPVRFWI